MRSRLRFVLILLIADFLLISVSGQNVTLDNRKSGYVNITELKFGVVSGDPKNLHSFGFESINGYNIKSLMSVGIGVGLDRFIFAPNAKYTMPFISLDLRWYPLNCKNTFLSNNLRNIFVACSAGYSYNLTSHQVGFRDEDCWGSFICPGVGYKIPIFARTSVSLNLGLKLQENTTHNLNMAIPTTIKLWNINAGIMF
jgi:hypothetical protein